MLAIAGSGFGLYGYLPAAAGACAQTIALPQRYRERFDARPELQAYADRIVWCADEAAALACADSAVLALRPGDQQDLVRDCLARPNIERLLLEKPLAPTPQEAARLHVALLACGKRFRIGYTFRFTPWAECLRASLALGRGLDIEWCFLAHHYRNELDNWKRHDALGGGAIRFFGIHLIALLAELGYRAVGEVSATHSGPGETAAFSAVFTGAGLAPCRVLVDSRSKSRQFTVKAGQDLLAELGDPFDGAVAVQGAGQADQRVPILERLCASLWGGQDDQAVYAWYGAAIDLWQELEARVAAGPVMLS